MSKEIKKMYGFSPEGKIFLKENISLEDLKEERETLKDTLKDLRAEELRPTFEKRLRLVEKEIEKKK